MLNNNYYIIKVKHEKIKQERRERELEAQNLKDYTKIIVETEEENPITIAEITRDEINVADGYRVRMTPKYD